ncbi:MAG: hypothetical protein PHZ02_07710, partial [Desulfocapsaceae bacterium]|nr:hypothetical protein [Desulfocapsaceae bacterium]
MTDHSYSTDTAFFLTVTGVPEDDKTLQLKAQALAESLYPDGKPFRQGGTAVSNDQFLLVYTAKGLELQTLNPETKR